MTAIPFSRLLQIAYPFLIFSAALMAWCKTNHSVYSESFRALDHSFSQSITGIAEIFEGSESGQIPSFKLRTLP